MRVGFFLYDIVDGLGNREFCVVFFAEHEERFGGGDAFGEFFRGQAAHEIFAEAAVVAVRGKQRRFVVAEVGQAVNGHRVASHRADEP